MEKQKLPIVLTVITLLLAVLFLLPHYENHVKSAAATNVVISEIQVTGNTADDEFVELYNPTSGSINLSGWRLRRTSGATTINLVSSLSGIIPAHGYFLIANPSYTGSTIPDMTYSASSSAITANNTVILYSDAGTTVVDKVGMGTAADKEGTTTVSPDAHTSIERKANSSSTSLTMAIGGIDEFAGNGEDTDNNSADFVTRTVPQPQNSSSPIEPIATSPTPTNTPTTTPTPTDTISPTPTDTAIPTPTSTPTDTPTPTETLSPTPTDTPTETPTPTVTVAPTPTETVPPTPTMTSTPTPISTPTPTNTPVPTATPTMMPTNTPTQTPTPTINPTPMPTTSPTPTMTPVPTPHPVVFNNPLFKCTITYTPYKLFNHFYIFVPDFVCVNK